MQHAYNTSCQDVQPVVGNELVCAASGMASHPLTRVATESPRNATACRVGTVARTVRWTAIRGSTSRAWMGSREAVAGLGGGRTAEDGRVVVQHHGGDRADEQRPDVGTGLLQSVAYGRHDVAGLRRALVGGRRRGSIRSDRVVHRDVRRLHRRQHGLPSREHPLQRERPQLLCTHAHGRENSGGGTGQRRGGPSTAAYLDPCHLESA